jgi:hypothetical protein
MRKLTILAAAAASVAAMGLAPATAAAKRCAETVEFNLHVVSASGMSCNRGAREIEGYEGPITRRFETPHNFKCKRVDGDRLSGKWRCRKDDKRFKFTFGD